jgi:hypothetical protein
MVEGDHGFATNEKHQSEIITRYFENIFNIEGEDEMAQLEELTLEVENSNNDSTRMYKAIKVLQSKKPKAKLMVEGDHGFATNEKHQSEIINHQIF